MRRIERTAESHPASRLAGLERVGIRLSMLALAVFGATFATGCDTAKQVLEGAAHAAAQEPSLLDPDAPNGPETALDRYIARPDPEFAWKVVSTSKGEGWTAATLELTSQKWRSEADVNRPVWKHWITVTIPDAVREKPNAHAFLFIGGGSNKDEAPAKTSERVAALAMETGTPVAELGQVPNQPLAFSDSKDKGRYEDDLIAYTRVKYMATHDENWLVRLAMVKSAVRAMDALQQYLPEATGGKASAEKFMVAGGSKRGWTTWLTAVVDPRVFAISPMVIDALNSEAITRHHYEAYGFFSKALEDYVNHGLFPDKIGTPEYRAILRIEDAYHYRNRERLRVPKYLINAAGDEFFLPDNSWLYYDEMPGPKYLRYVPNAKHSLAGSDARETLRAFYQAVMDGRELPEIAWKKGEDGSLHVDAKGPAPVEVNVWKATNPDARDFRLDKIGPAYEKHPMPGASDDMHLAYRPEDPEKGWTAFFVEFVYDYGYGAPLKFTTGVSVVPDVLPYKWEDALKGPVRLE